MRRVLRRPLRVVLQMLYRVKYENSEKMPLQGPAILVANHVATGDMLMIHCKVVPWVYWAVKKELFTNRLARWALGRWGAIPVVRSRPDVTAARRLLRRLQEGGVIGICPQGTRVRRTEDIAKVRLKNGAAHLAYLTGVPVVPVAVVGDFRLLHRTRIVFGDPFVLSSEEGRRFTRKDVESASRQIMCRVFALIGVDYPLEEAAGCAF